MGYMDTNEAAVILKFHPKTVRRMCKDGVIPATRIGGEFRIDKREFRAYLESQRVPKPPSTAQSA